MPLFSAADSINLLYLINSIPENRGCDGFQGLVNYTCQHDDGMIMVVKANIYHTRDRISKFFPDFQIRPISPLIRLCNSGSCQSG
jgi:hypothetical protein